MTEDGWPVPLNRVPDRVELLRKMPMGGVAVEVGVHMGVYGKYIERIIEPTRLYLIDDFDPDSSVDIIIDGIPEPIFGHERQKRIEQKFYTGIASGRVKILKSSSLADAIKQIPEPIDFIYLGCLPEYNVVLEILEAAYTKVKNRGWICGHDYCEIFDSGVPRAVKTFITKYGLRLNILTEEEKLRVFNRFGINANLPPMISYDSFGIIKDGKESRSWL